MSRAASPQATDPAAPHEFSPNVCMLMNCFHGGREALIKIRGQLFGQPIEDAFSELRSIRFSNLWTKALPLTTKPALESLAVILNQWQTKVEAGKKQKKAQQHHAKRNEARVPGR